MNSSLEEDIKSIWRYPNKGVERIIFINITVFILLILGDWIFKGGMTAWLAMPLDIKGLPLKFWTPITSFFSHADFFQLIINVIWLYFFGKIMIDLIGNEKLIGAYMLGGIVGSASVVLLAQWFPILKSQQYYIGSHACTFAVVTAVTTLTPNYRVNLIFIGQVKVKYIFLITLVYIVYMWLANKSSDVYILNLIGICTGYAYIKLLQKGHDYGDWIVKTINSLEDIFSNKKRTRGNFKAKKTKQKVKVKNCKDSEENTSQLTSQKEVDMILNKIQAHGYDSLTKEEKEKLFNS